MHSCPFITKPTPARSGLVLLVVLGMLGLFTLLAITYLTVSTQSRTASQSLVRAKLQPSLGEMINPDVVAKRIVAGDTNNQSPFYGQSLLEDVYGRDPIQGEFDPAANSAVLNVPGKVGIMKVQLKEAILVNPDPFRDLSVVDEKSYQGALSVENDFYTGRIITFLEGPLANQSYRILGYLGYPARNSGGALLPDFDYSIAIDLSETKADRLTATVVDPAGGNREITYSGSLVEWLQLNSNNPTIFTANNGNGYRYLINDLPFNGLGYGIEREPSHPNFGNLDQSRLVPNTRWNGTGYDAGFESFPLALLPHYDYLSKDTVSGSLGTGLVGGTAVEVTGSTNEGFDVPDYHDYWLAHVPARTGGAIAQGDIIPSFHRPELVNYIANYYVALMGGLNGLSELQLIRMVQLIDYACARPLSYRLTNCPVPNGFSQTQSTIERNLDFKGRSDTLAIPTLEMDLSNLTTARAKLTAWVKALIGGGTPATSAWDVDNDGDGIAEGVWLDPKLPLLTSPEGRHLKALVSTLIVDLDGRININVAGDPYQQWLRDGSGNYRTRLETGADTGFARSGTANPFLPQGLGYGPAEISLAHLFSWTDPNPPNTTYNQLTPFLNSRYGNDAGGVHVPGRAGQDRRGQYFQQRELHFDTSGNPYGLQQARRGTIAYGLDRLGNPRMSDVVGGPSNEFVDDPYEVNGLDATSGDVLVTLDEIEAVLRRYDDDFSQLPDRMRKLFSAKQLNDAVFDSMTARSVELRYPNMAAVARHTRTYVKADPVYGSSAPTPYPRRNSAGGTFNAETPNGSGNRLIANGRTDGSFLRWIQMLYDERYPTGPVLNISDIRELFPIEFRQALRMDLNRPFGNGVDDDGDGLIDETNELSGNQTERYPTNAADVTANGTYYSASMPPRATTPTEGNIAADVWSQYIGPQMSRKMFARNLYCLAQLLIEPTYPFGGIPSTSMPDYQRVRARSLAQWAVNVVDFRDSDATMTRFEYDETPFQTETGDASVWAPKTDMVVWGMEFPELLMTETLAFHDKRVKDTMNDSTLQKTTALPVTVADDDFDQYRIPQGSAFIEFYNPRSPGGPVNSVTGDLGLGVAPSNLYNAAGALVISKLAPAPTIAGSPDYGQQPVFRVGIAQLPPGEDPGTIINSANDKTATPAARNTSYAKLNRTTNQSSISGIGPTGYNASGLVGYVDQPASNNFFGQTSRLLFNRVLWFSSATVGPTQIIPDLVYSENSANPSFGERPHRVFRCTTAGATMPAGSYVVVGPRQMTDVGVLNSGTTPPVYEPSPQRITLSGNVNVGRFDGTSAFVPTGVGPAQTLVAVAEPPTGAWTSAVGGGGPAPLVDGVGFNISEPTPVAARYYTLPTTSLNKAAAAPGNFPRSDSYADIEQGQNTLPDEPFDNDPAPNMERLASENKERPGTYPLHRTAYLQRLADPDLAYHPEYNPYITIDWMNMDLTVFNGEDTEPVDDPARVDGGMPAPYVAPVEEKSIAAGVAFQSRYKDGARISDAPDTQDIVTMAQATATPRYTFTDPTLPDVQTGVSIFSASTAYLIRSTPATSFPGAAFPPYFQHELGFPTAASTRSSVTLGFLNVGRVDASNRFDGFGDPAAVAGNYSNIPQHPQAGLFWFNRPFAGPHELIMVPSTGPGQLGQFFTMPKNPVTPTNLANGFFTGQYDLAARPANATAEPWASPFGYLPNFFSSPELKVTAGGGSPFWQRPPAGGGTNPGAGWQQVLELVETPPVFADGKRWMDPSNLSGGNNIQNYLLGARVAPFNFVSNYRVPGKVNLNTIKHQSVLDAIEFNYDQTARNIDTTSADYGNRTTRWNELNNLRRGYALPAPNPGTFFASAADTNTNLDAFIPTQFRGAFRPSFSVNMDVANQPGITVPPPALAASGQTMRMNRAAYSGITRPNASSPENGMLFGPSLEAQRGMTSVGATDAHLAAEFTRSPFEYHRRLMRLSNLTTNQSNVFAVWVTVGLFEYDEVNGIGAEYIGGAGSPERTRAFYIIDRSIPVGFAPGKAYNTENTILLRRKLPR